MTKSKALIRLEIAIEDEIENALSVNSRAMAIEMLRADRMHDVKRCAYDLIEAIINEIKSATQKDDA